jgi:hypothetical protein
VPAGRDMPRPDRPATRRPAIRPGRIAGQITRRHGGLR